MKKTIVKPKPKKAPKKIKKDPPEPKSKKMPERTYWA